MIKEKKKIETYLRKHEYHASLAKSTLLKEIKFIFENSTYLKKAIDQINDTKKENSRMNQQETTRKKKLYHDKNKIDTIIQNYQDKSLQKHSNIFETLQLLRQKCNFSSIKSKVETYFKRCFSYQRDKSEKEQSS